MDLTARRRVLLAMQPAAPKNLIPSDDSSNPMAHYTHTSSGTVTYDAAENAYESVGYGIAQSKHSGQKDRLFIAPRDMTITFSVWYKNFGTTYGMRFYKNGSRITDIHGDADSEWHQYTYKTNLSAGGYLSIAFYAGIFWRDLQVLES